MFFATKIPNPESLSGENDDGILIAPTNQTESWAAPIYRGNRLAGTRYLATSPPAVSHFEMKMMKMIPK